MPSGYMMTKRVGTRSGVKSRLGFVLLGLVSVAVFACSGAKRTPTLPPPEFEPPDLPIEATSSAIPSASSVPTAPSTLEPLPSLPSPEPSTDSGESAPALAASVTTGDASSIPQPDRSRRIEDPK